MGMEHYVKVKDLGGTNGAFLARDRQLPDRLVVIKRLADGTQGIEELNASLRLRHPHIIRFLESCIYEGSLYVIMSYEPGGDLDELFRYLVQRHKTPTTHTLLLWFVQLLDALVYCHENHVIHRDIKPGNILVSEDTKLLYLGDFGSAKTLATSNVTSTFVGSPMWISPEVLLGTSYGHPADVWSLGCVFYEMATLRKPFTAPSFAHLVQQITRGHVAPLPANLAPEVRSIIHSMLVLDPAQRVTARAALETARAALERAEAQRHASPPPVRSAASPESSPPRRVAAPQEPTPVRQHAPSPATSTTTPPLSPPLPPQPMQHGSPQRVQPAPAPAPARPAPLATPPPLTETSAPPASATRTPLTSAEAKAGEDPTPHGFPPAAVLVVPAVETPTHAVLMKRRPGAASSSTSSPTPSVGPAAEVTTPQAPRPAVTAARAPTSTPPPMPALVPPEEDAEEVRSTSSEPQLCTPQQMVLHFSTAGFGNKPAPRKKKAAPKRSAPAAPVASRPSAASPAAAAAAAAATSTAAPQPARRKQVTSVPAPAASGSEAPKFVRQLTGDSLLARRAFTAGHTSAAEAITPSRASGGSAKVVVKAGPPPPVARRAQAAADNADHPPRAPQESPRRMARAQAAAAATAQQHQPRPTSIVPTKAVAQPPSAGAAPADQWFDQRMRDLCAMEKYLHQHRVEDDKALQTYDARRREEAHQQESAPRPRAAARPSPAPRLRSPAKEFTNPVSAAGVLVMTPPRRRHQSNEIPAPPPAAAHAQGSQQRQCGAGAAAASPFARQASYARQASNGHGRIESRQESLSSTYSGHQASNARARPRVSPEEQQRNEEDRAVAREKREAERQRMKELISAQRAAAKKQKRKTKKNGAAAEVEIVLPDKLHYTANGVVPIE